MSSFGNTYWKPGPHVAYVPNPIPSLRLKSLSSWFIAPLYTGDFIRRTSTVPRFAWCSCRWNGRPRWWRDVPCSPRFPSDGASSAREPEAAAPGPDRRTGIRRSRHCSRLAGPSFKGITRSTLYFVLNSDNRYFIKSNVNVMWTFINAPSSPLI